VRTAGTLALFLTLSILTRVPAHAQGPTFQPAFENEIWRSQPPDKIGKRVQPDCITAWVWNDEVGHETPSEPVADFNGCDAAAQWAQESEQIGTGGHDQLLFPTGVAVYDPAFTPNRPLTFPNERRVIVADRYNSRILSFRGPSNGTWFPIANSAENGIPGEPDDLEIALADWNGFSPGTTPAYDGLSFPEHITVDSGGYVWVANEGRCGIDVFTPTGVFVDRFELDSLCGESVGIHPYGVALNDNAVYNVSGKVAVTGIDYQSQGTVLVVFDAATGSELARHAPDPLVGEFDDPGNLNHATAVDYLTVEGREYLVVADTDNNRIQVFGTNAGGAPMLPPVLIFGATPLTGPGGPVTASRLQWPYSVLVDRRGRLIVSDSIGNRAAVFRLTLPASGPASAAFVYELNARGGLNGVPRGLAEDSDGRLYIADTGNHEIEVFEIPELAVVNVNLVTPTVRTGQVATVEFDVVVPETKGAVNNVSPRCAATGNLSVTPGQPRVVSAPDSNIPVPSMPPTVVNGVGGPVHRYACDFVASTTPGTFSISLWADGSVPEGAVTAPTKSATGRIITCAAPCENTVPTIASTATSTPAPVTTDIGTYYPGTADITLTATDSGANASGIARIYWRWISSSAMSVAPLTDPCPDQPSPIQCAVFTTPAASRNQIVQAPLNGLSTLEFWAEDFNGNVSTRVTRPVAVDTVPPDFLIEYRTPPTGADEGTFWFNTDVVLDLAFSDALTPPARIVTIPANITELRFTGQGRDLSQTFDLQDLALNTWQRAYGAPIVSSEWIGVNIDRGRPTTAATVTVGAQTTPLTNDQIFDVSQPPGRFTLTATDPLLPQTTPPGGDRTPSGIATRFAVFNCQSIAVPANGVITPEVELGPNVLEYWSKDFAGNEDVQRNVRNFWLNAAPTAVDDGSLLAPITTSEDVAIDVNVVANDTDPNNGVAVDPACPRATTETLSVIASSLTPPTNGAGTVSVNANGTIRFQPALNFSGTTTFTYRVADQHTGTSAEAATVRITVVPVNDPPAAVADPASTNENTPVAIDVLANDSDVDSPVFTIESVTQPAHGTAAIAGTTVLYTPAAGYSGPDSFTYRTTDGLAASSFATVTINVISTSNQPPSCGNAKPWPSVIWPPNHKPAVVFITGVSDTNGDHVHIRIDRILQDEPTNTYGDGETDIDGGGIGWPVAWVRAERTGGQNGRIYEIFFTATDRKGASCSGKVTVGVPHDKGRAAVDSGCRWDSTVKNGRVLSCKPGTKPPRPDHDDDDDCDDDDHDHGHHKGDDCDHERGRKGHKRGDKCDHERRVGR
jgi:hypothetical protein